MFNRVAILGLGLIGGSVGLALHAAKAAQHVAGYDLGKGVSERARKRGAIDQSYNTLADAVRGAELIVLAMPTGAIRTLLQDMAPSLASGTVVTDVTSTKTQVISWAEEFLPVSVSFVGGHPIVGKEESGIEAADAHLFQDRVYCLTPTARTRPAAIDKVSGLVEALGAHIRFLEPAEHDGQVAGVSHLPLLATVSLVNTVAGGPAWEDASLLAPESLHDVSQLIAGNPEILRDICLTNGEAITRWLDAYIATLRTMREQIATHDKALSETIAHAQRLQRQQEQHSSK